MLVFVFNVNAQTDFEDLSLQTDTFWNGSDLSGGFISGDSYFVNYYDTAYYSWAGFAYSNKTDSNTIGFANQYSAMAGSGYNNSENYAVSYVSSFFGTTYMTLGDVIVGPVTGGFHVTNNAYAYYSMKDGDAFSKKFGGVSGDDPDWFKLNIIGYGSGVFIDSVEFYLADYRFTDNSQDYIIRNWTYVDIDNLFSMGCADSLVFELSSSDVGAFGMNTPAYFCLDNVDIISGIETIYKNDINIFPNPVKDILTIENIENSKIMIYDISGKTVYLKQTNNNNEKINLSEFNRGVYFITISNNEEIITKKIVKN